MLNSICTEGSYLFSAINKTVDTVSDAISEHLIVPGIKKGYSILGTVVADNLGRSSPEKKKKIQEAWYDPFSTDTILKVSEKVEALSKRVAQDTPTENKGLSYIDTCLISSSQQLYKYIKEVNYILRLPKQLKGYCEKISLSNVTNKCSIIFGRPAKWLSQAIVFLKKALLTLIDLVITAVDSIFGFFFMKTKFEFLGYIREIVRESLGKVNAKFVDTAQKAIEKRENTLRKQVIQEIADYTVTTSVKTATRVATKGIIGLACYSVATNVLEAVLPSMPIDTSMVVGAAATTFALGSFWKYVAKPTLDSFYETYDPEFDPATSGLKDFCKQYNLEKFYYLIKAVGSYLSEDKKSSPKKEPSIEEEGPPIDLEELAKNNPNIQKTLDWIDTRCKKSPESMIEGEKSSNKDTIKTLNDVRTII